MNGRGAPACKHVGRDRNAEAALPCRPAFAPMNGWGDPARKHALGGTGMLTAAPACTQAFVTGALIAWRTTVA